MSHEAPMPEITDLIIEAGGEELSRCMHCGTCTGLCPWNQVGGFSPRLLIRQASLGLEGYEAQELWKCVACQTCSPNCPREIDIPEVIRAARQVMVEAGEGPRTQRGALASLRMSGNPWSGEREERAAWLEGLGQTRTEPGAGYTFFTCCTQAYDPRNQRSSRALFFVLEAAGVPLAFLGGKESCCGDQARSVGAEQIYQTLKSANLELLNGHERIITASPHCLQVLDKDYRSELPLQAYHYTQVLAECLDSGRLAPRLPLEMAVTYHDPCYLGRHAGEFEAPRRLLSAIPGLDLVEMPRSRENSLCCGGGGGGIWMDVPKEQRFAIHRIREAVGTGAKVVATACPYCAFMLEDAIKVAELEGVIQVLDVAELLAESLGLGSNPAAPSDWSRRGRESSP